MRIVALTMTAAGPFALLLLAVAGTPDTIGPRQDPAPPAEVNGGSLSRGEHRPTPDAHDRGVPHERHPPMRGVPDGGQTHGEHPSGVLGLPMSREASGTAWQPDTAPAFGWHFETGRFRWALHGLLFAGWDRQGTRRGGGAFVSTNWVMAMVRTDLAGGQLGGRLMLSAEPATVGRHGYPLLFQSGEAVDGEALVDRQHPHDLFMELAVLWERPLGRDLALQLYAAPSGEPALGPPAFPHRASAFADPLAPLGHHWQDATHITFGVLTGGLFTRFAKLEASWFAGREPDENRWDIDLGGLDSWSTRLTVNPWRAVSAQVSVGYLRSPEALAPELDIRRLTGSVQAIAPLGDDDYLAATWALGRNAPVRGAPPTDSALAEGLLALGAWSLFTRVEWVEKTGHDLDLDDLAGSVLPIPSVALGAVRDLPGVGPMVPGIGVRAAASPLPAALTAIYGTEVAWGGMVYVRLRPPLVKGHGP